MCTDLFHKYIECGHTKSTGREECQNVNLCRGRSIRERTERVEGMCQRCLEALERMYRMNGLDFSNRGGNVVEGERSFEVEKRRLEARRAKLEAGQARESEDESVVGCGNVI